MSEQYYGVYRVLKGGKHRYVSRSATANKRLAESIAEDLTRGEIVLPTDATKQVKPYPHVALPIETAKKNPRTVESGELAIYAINNRDLYRQRTLPILANLKKKIAKGKYDAALALKLWKYAADDAAQRYAKEFGGVWHEMFSVADRKEAAKEMADHYAEELTENPRKAGRYQTVIAPYSLESGRVGQATEPERIISTHKSKKAAQDRLGSIISGKQKHLQPRGGFRIFVRDTQTGEEISRTGNVLKKNPRSRVRRPAQKRYRGGFPGYIVTWINPKAVQAKRQYMGGYKGSYTVVYKRKLSRVFSTSDKAKNAVRNNRKWFDVNGVKQVTILQTNEAANKFQ